MTDWYDDEWDDTDVDVPLAAWVTLGGFVTTLLVFALLIGFLLLGGWTHG